MKRLSRVAILLVGLLCIAPDARCDSAKDHYADGVSKGEKGDFDGALSELDEAIKLDPNLAAAYFARGRARQSKSDLAGAIADYTKAIDLKPDYFQAYDSRGVAM